MSLPLFDERHARRVLEAYGRAFGCLPSEDVPLTRSQRKFIEAAVSELAQNGRIVCIHLAVFAETAKGHAWEFSELRQMGGWQGIGRQFVAGIFNFPETPDFIKKNSASAWNILRQLLPVTSEPIKGKSLTRNELLEKSGIKNEKVFDELVHFLERESCLITPVDHGHEDDPDAFQPHDFHFGLTHDFLVEPIRAWGSAKDNETRQGRATSQLVRLAEQWKLTKDNRFLPSPIDYFRIRRFAQADSKQMHSDFIKTAERRSLSMILGGLALLFALAIPAGFYYSSYRESQADLIIRNFVSCSPVQFREHWEKIAENLPKHTDRLARFLEDGDAVARQRARLALLANASGVVGLDEDFGRELRELPVGELRNLITIAQTNPKLIPVLEELAVTSLPPASHCRLAILLAYFDRPDTLATAMQPIANPQIRTEAILQLRSWNVGFVDLLNKLPKSGDRHNGNMLCAVLSSIGLSGSDYNEHHRDELVDTICELYRQHPHAGTHSAAWFALKRLNAEIPRVDHSAIENCQWRLLSLENQLSRGKVHEITLVRIEAGSFQPTPNPVFDKIVGGNDANYDGVIENDYWISAFEVSRDLFDEFLAGKATEPWAIELAEQRAMKKNEIAKQESASRLSWPSAAMFCNWLSDRLFSKNAVSYELDQDNWKSHRVAFGVRLPTQEEFEWALRAGSTTSYVYGDNGSDNQCLELFYGLNQGEKFGKPGALMPNANGCFDLASNVSEWLDDHQSEQKSLNAKQRFSAASAGYSDCVSGSFIVYPAHLGIYDVGFRICANLE